MTMLIASKHKVRELAMQVLFLWDANGQNDAEMGRRAITGVTDDHEILRAAMNIAEGAWSQRSLTDQWIERLAPQWPPRRQPGVDRNILRLALWELTHAKTPPKVVIDEAIELAKEFSTEQSPAFVNGVLDAVLKERERLVSAEPPSQNDETRMTGQNDEVRMTNDESMTKLE